MVGELFEAGREGWGGRGVSSEFGWGWSRGDASFELSMSSSEVLLGRGRVGVLECLRRGLCVCGWSRVATSVAWFVVEEMWGRAKEVAMLKLARGCGCLVGREDEKKKGTVAKGVVLDPRKITVVKAGATVSRARA